MMPRAALPARRKINDLRDISYLTVLNMGIESVQNQWVIRDRMYLKVSACRIHLEVHS